MSEGWGKTPRGGKHLLPCPFVVLLLFVGIGKKDRAGQNKKYGMYYKDFKSCVQFWKKIHTTQTKSIY